MLNNGMHKPDSYFKDSIENLISSITNSSIDVENIVSITDELTSTSDNPNIIMVQLESFFAPKYINDAEIKE